jgi:hypothetical protein
MIAARVFTWPKEELSGDAPTTSPHRIPQREQSSVSLANPRII